MQIGNRIIYDQEGRIIFQTGEREGIVVANTEITELHFIDLDYGVIDRRTHVITGVDVVTKQPLLEVIKVHESSEQIRIRELEDALLIAADAETGGIL